MAVNPVRSDKLTWVMRSSATYSIGLCLVFASACFVVNRLEKRNLRSIRRRSYFRLITQNHRPIALAIVKRRPLRESFTVGIAVGREIDTIGRKRIRDLTIQVRPRARRKQVTKSILSLGAMSSA